tara:strand:+ start:613 stop:1227 length:615 start_codon:yes stop_codon:yes gene_type:complete
MKQTFNRRFPKKYNNLNNNNWNKKNNIYSAGILPYGKDSKGNVYFLLGKDKQLSWSDFGGRVELKDNQDTKETAIREFYEETYNSVIEKKYLREILSIERNYNLITSKTLNGSPYYMYVIEVELDENMRKSFVKTYEYLKYVKVNEYILEKTDIQWVSLSTLLACIDDDKNEIAFGWNLRKVFKNTLINNKKQFIKIFKDLGLS